MICKQAGVVNELYIKTLQVGGVSCRSPDYGEAGYPACLYSVFKPGLPKSLD